MGGRGGGRAAGDSPHMGIRCEAVLSVRPVPSVRPVRPVPSVLSRPVLFCPSRPVLSVRPVHPVQSGSQKWTRSNQSTFPIRSDSDRILLSFDLTGSNFGFLFLFRHVVCHRRCSSGPTAACFMSLPFSFPPSPFRLSLSVHVLDNSTTRSSSFFPPPLRCAQLTVSLYSPVLWDLGVRHPRHARSGHRRSTHRTNLAARVTSRSSVAERAERSEANDSAPSLACRSD